MKIALWLTHGLGDVVMSVPMLQDYLTKNNTYYIYTKSTTNQDVIKYFTSHDNIIFINIKSKLDLIKVFFQKYDKFLLIHGSNNIFFDLFFYFSRSKNIIYPGCEKVKFKFFNVDRVQNQNSHKVNYFRKFGSLHPINRYRSPEYETNIINKEYVLIAPGSGELEKHKRWNCENWAKLIELIDKKFSFKVSVLISEKEKIIFDNIQEFSNEKVNVEIVKSIMDSVAAIKKAFFVVSVCNGTSHLCSILDIPIVGIYGPTNPSYTGVFNQKQRILRKDYKCSPCYRADFMKGCYNPICIKDINPSDVINEIIKLLNKEYSQFKILTSKKTYMPQV